MQLIRFILFSLTLPLTLLATSEEAMFGVTPARTGVFNTAPLTNTPTIAWENRNAWGNGGSVASTPSALYLVTDRGELTSLNLSNGDVNWSLSLGYPFSPSGPAVDSEKNLLVVGTGGTSIRAFQATSGADLWSFTTKGGVVTSPVIQVGNQVYVADDAGYVYLLDGETGALIWEALVGLEIYSSPSLSANRVFVATTDGYIVALNQSDGSEAWRTFLHREMRATTPTANGLVLATNIIDRLIALNMTTGEVVWEAHILLDRNTTPAVSGSFAYLVDLLGVVHAVDLSTGQTHWRTALFQISLTPPVLAGNILYVATKTQLNALDATTGDSLWSFPIEGNLTSQPSIRGGRAYIKTTQATYALR